MKGTQANQPMRQDERYLITNYSVLDAKKTDTEQSAPCRGKPALRVTPRLISYLWGCLETGSKVSRFSSDADQVII